MFAAAALAPFCYIQLFPFETLLHLLRPHMLLISRKCIATFAQGLSLKCLLLGDDAGYTVVHLHRPLCSGLI